MNSVTVRAPAKLNWTLDITGKREDGYHTVDMLMQTVSLYEQVTVRKSSGFLLRLPGSFVPAGENNTAAKAARAFWDETGLLAGADITVHKAVPVRAGMAGGSADAAAVLVGLNELYGARLTLAQLCGIGLKVGADVPFCLQGGTARVTGIGEVLRALPPCPPCWFTVCMPGGSGVSTPQAYARYDRLGTPCRPANDAAEAAICAGDLTALCASLGNALEFSSQSKANGPIEKLLRGAGALAALMTGSGAAVYGVFDSAEKAHAARRALAEKGHLRTWVLHPVPQGAQVLRKAAKV